MRASRSAFAECHRARRIRAGLIALGWIAVTGAVAGASVLVGAASPRVEASVVATSAISAASHSDAAVVSPADVPATETSVPPGVAAIPPSSQTSAVPSEGPRAFRIAITATGYQAELDACQWVRMDLLDTAPFVGAHTSCGGRIILTMKPGDSVTLVGQGLDGTFRVADARDAHAGDLATAAVEGMTASVILQTCYPGAGGRERLVALQPQP